MAKAQEDVVGLMICDLRSEIGFSLLLSFE
jgi:hypothetical protein